MNPQVWGETYWQVGHALAARINGRAHAEVAHAFATGFLEGLPCSVCSDSAVAFRDKLLHFHSGADVMERVALHELGLAKWFYEMHLLVNEKLDAQRFEERIAGKGLSAAEVARIRELGLYRGKILPFEVVYARAMSVGYADEQVWAMLELAAAALQNADGLVRFSGLLTGLAKAVAVAPPLRCLAPTAFVQVLAELASRVREVDVRAEIAMDGASSGAGLQMAVFEMLFNAQKRYRWRTALELGALASKGAHAPPGNAAVWPRGRGATLLTQFTAASAGMNLRRLLEAYGGSASASASASASGSSTS